MHLERAGDTIVLIVRRHSEGKQQHRKLITICLPFGIFLVSVCRVCVRCPFASIRFYAYTNSKVNLSRQWLACVGETRIPLYAYSLKLDEQQCVRSMLIVYWREIVNRLVGCTFWFFAPVSYWEYLQIQDQNQLRHQIIDDHWVNHYFAIHFS